MKTKPCSSVLIVLIACVLFTGLSGFTRVDDDPILAKILAQLNTWSTTYPTEKTYLQLDKPIYSAGDDIWFKAYITYGNDHYLSDISGTLIVELIDSRDSVKQWVKLPVSNGIAWGDIALPDVFPGGNYRLRAYTNLMRNAGRDYYFDKPIMIGNAVRNKVFTSVSYTSRPGGDITATINYADLDNIPYANKPVDYKIQLGDKQLTRGKGTTDNKGNLIITIVNPTATGKKSIVTDIKLDNTTTVAKTIPINTSTKPDVQFFPESGNLVNGVRSKVAFKAVGADGLGIAVKGVIIDNLNHKVADIDAQHLGMGAFSLLPESGKTYKAAITFADGSESTINLPAALNSGYVLAVINTDDDNIAIKVTGSNDLANSGLYIIAQAGGQVCYVAKSAASGAFTSTIIPKSKFPSGIVQFTLFSATGEPLNERIAFIRHKENMLRLTVNSDKAISAIRNKIKIDLDAQDSNGKPVVGSFSAAVINENPFQGNESAGGNILSHILLTSDLRGYIEQPGYYFANNSEATVADLDVLMLAQGYRRFAWKSLLAGSFQPPAYQPEKFITISGNVRRLNGKPVEQAKVMLYTKASSTMYLLDTVSDKDGHFAFKDLMFKDSLHFKIQARTANDSKNVKITLDNNGSKDMINTNDALSPINFYTSDTLVTNYLRAGRQLYDEELKFGLGNHTILLKEVNVIDNRKIYFKHSDNLNGPGKADYTATAEEIDKLSCPNIYDCILPFLPGVVVQNDILYYMQRNVGRQLGYHELYMIVDGIPVTDIHFLNIHDIASLEFLVSAGYSAIYGIHGNNGVLIITTKKGGETLPNEYQVAEPGTLSYSPKGYYRTREFYSPQYDDPKTNKSVADLRTTIFWKPNIITNETGHSSFEYYNAGTPGTYKLTIEGIDVNGNLAYKVYRYKVQ